MVQFDRAVLVVEHNGRTGTFELRNSLETRAESRRNFVLGGRGGLINEIIGRSADSDNGEDGSEDGVDSREQFFLDGGAGTREKTLTANLVGGTGGETLQMGDGSSNPDDASDVTQWDATNSHEIAQWQVLDHFLSEARTDSDNPATLHWGLYSDGSEIDAGVYAPLDVVVLEWNVERGRDEPSTARVAITMQSAASFAAATDALENDQR